MKQSWTKRGGSAAARLGAIVLASVALTACAPPVLPGYEDVDFSTMTMEEKGQYVYECLTDKGWDVEVHEDGGISGEGDSSQVPQFAADSSACDAPIQAAAIPQSAWSQESWTELYELMLSEAECLEGIGYSVSDPPSREVFIENTLAGDQWAPSLATIGQTPPQGVDPEVACPQVDFIPRRG